MKKLYTLLALAITLIASAQAPQGFNYQATVRNSAGALIVNQNVNFKFNIMLNSATSLPVFSENHMVPTDDVGQVNLVIGQGTASIGSFSSINWGTGNYYLGIELNTGSGYVTMGTTQLLSVPYALYANSSGSSNSNLPSGTNIGDRLNWIWNGTAWIPTPSSALIPQITTTLISSVTNSTANSGGVISNSGGDTISAKGVCWSTSPNPTIALTTKTNNGIGTTTFSSNISGLLPITTYYVRAYATNSFGTAYGQEEVFTTLSALPSLTTIAATSITTTTASSGGTISSDGGAPIIDRGIVWSSISNPTILTNQGLTSDGTGLGSFTSAINQLIPGTLYYVRAYATNSSGTAYGNQITFSALPVIPNITTVNFSQISGNSGNSGGTIASNGGATITAKGVCWSTSPNPTIELTTKTNDGTGSANFTSNISGLSPVTTYYIRAYATNSVGTAYGQELTFTTLPLSNGNIGTQIWSVTNLDVTTYRDGTLIPQVTDPNAWANLTTGAWCYYNNDSANGTIYGKLYNWYAVAGIHDNDPNTPNKVLAPTGWHIPTDSEWTTLTDFLGGMSIAGGKMKSTGTSLWQSPNTGATNESGFTSLPGGGRNINGPFLGIGLDSFFWSASEINSTNAFFHYLNYSLVNIQKISTDKQDGFSVRCVMD
jgi:uncharacterized protein (TIGR02145 family)